MGVQSKAVKKTSRKTCTPVPLEAEIRTRLAPDARFKNTTNRHFFDFCTQAQSFITKTMHGSPAVLLEPFFVSHVLLAHFERKLGEEGKDCHRVLFKRINSVLYLEAAHRGGRKLVLANIRYHRTRGQV